MFFFKQKTAYEFRISDCSSDVCSSDLRAHRSAAAQLTVLKEEATRANTEADYHQFLYDELDAAKLEAGEAVQLETEQQQLEHAEEIKRSLLGTANALQEGEANAVSLVKEALQQMQQAERHMPALSPQAERLQRSFIELKRSEGQRGGKGWVSQWRSWG